MVSLIKDEPQLDLNVRTASMSDASQCVPTPMRITMVISSLGGGGAERVMSAMAKYWVESGRKVTLITLAETGEDFYALHPEVKRVALGLMGNSQSLVGAVRNNVQRVLRLRKEIRASKPDVVLSFVDKMNVIVLAGTLGLGMPVIVSERTDPRHHSIGFVWRCLQFLFYRRAEAIVMLTEGVRGWAKRLVRPDAIRVIPNPVSIPTMRYTGAPNVRNSGHTVAAMGRLSREKGCDLLLRAFARCVRKYPDWSLIILGEGPERSRLEALICELGLKDQVSLPGLVREPSSVLRHVDLFVLPSRYEGFPNALVEAMALGRAVISTDCPSGPSEIIRDGVDGVLVPSNNVDALALAMERLMASQGERERLGTRAVEVVERFSVERIMSLWDDLFVKICKARNHF